MLTKKKTREKTRKPTKTQLFWYVGTGTGQLQLISPPLSEEVSDFQIKSGEINFSGENWLISSTPTSFFSACGGPFLPCKIHIFGLQTLFFFRLRRAKDFPIRGKLTFSEKMLGKLTLISSLRGGDINCNWPVLIERE